MLCCAVLSTVSIKVRELCSSLQTTSEEGPRLTLLQALRHILETAVKKVSDKMSGLVNDTLQQVKQDLLDEREGGADPNALEKVPELVNVFFCIGALQCCKAFVGNVESAAASIAVNLSRNARCNSEDEVSSLKHRYTVSCVSSNSFNTSLDIVFFFFVVLQTRCTPHWRQRANCKPSPKFYKHNH